MEELDLKELLNYYLKKLPVIIMMTLLVILLGYGYIEYYQVPMYHGKTTIILIQKNGNLNGAQNNLNETANQLNVNEKLVATYSEIIKSRRVLEQVKETLELKESLKTLENSIEVDSISDTAIIEITVSNESAEQATQIANQLAQVFKTEISKLYNLENISIIDEAIVETSPYNVNVIKQMFIYTMIGIIISCIFIFIIYYFDNTIKNRKEIETKIDIPVLGEVPLSLKLVKKEDSSKKKTKTKISIRIKKGIKKLKEKQVQKKKLSQEKRLELKESKKLKKIQKQEPVKPISSKEELPKKIRKENKKEPKETKTTTVKKKNPKVKNEVNMNKTNKKSSSSKETSKKKTTKPNSQKKTVTKKKSQEKE